MAVKHVGVRELRNDLAENLQGNETIVTKRHGKVIGLYLPVQEIDREKVAAALEEFQAAVNAALEQSGMTREEFANALDLTRPDDEAHD
jgi:hypothetical protein